jgi:4-aminobutyrate aminotransferase / (S)-3-amino-2-methylpropionate transaminase / 5-aminovalerate transaminase
MAKLSEPKMLTRIPGPKAAEIMKRLEKNVPQGVFITVPTFIKRGEGALFEDVDGNILIDFAGGIGVLNIGYCHTEVVEAVKEQCEKFFHSSVNVIPYELYVSLAEKLNSMIPGDFDKKTMFVNSGAEADENAVKIARKYTKRTEIVAFTGAFHGRTNMTMALTSKVKPYKFGFGPFAPGVHQIPYPYCYRCPYEMEKESCGIHCAKQMESFFIEQVTAEDIAAIIIEPVQGEAGFVTAPIEYIKELRRICDQHGILLIADEVQTGYCRTGKMYATEYWAEHGVYADIVTSAKSLAAGLPLSSVTAKAEIISSAQVGGIGGTFCGNPIAAAAALKVIEVMERDNFADRSKEIGKVCMDRFTLMQEKYKIVGDVRGLGAMVAIELVKDRETKEAAKDETKHILEECYQNGLVALNAGTRGNVIRILVPLVITDAQLEKGLDILDAAIGKFGA